MLLALHASGLGEVEYKDFWKIFKAAFFFFFLFFFFPRGTPLLVEALRYNGNVRHDDREGELVWKDGTLSNCGGVWLSGGG